MTLSRSPYSSRRLFAAAALVGLLLALLGAAAPARAAEVEPWWRLDSKSAPTNLKPGDTEDKVVVTASNLGDATVDGSKHPITITDALPPGLKATAIVGAVGVHSIGELGGKMTCKLETLSCTYTEKLAPYELLEVVITVKVEGPEGTVVNQAEVSGGEGLTQAGEPSGIQPEGQSRESPLHVSSSSTPFDIEKVELTPEDEHGNTDTQAGNHPFQLTTTLDLNEVIERNAATHLPQRAAPQLLKDLQVELPPGMIGNPNAIEPCSDVNFSSIENVANACTADTVVGVAVLTINEPANFKGFVTEAVPVFNLVPAPGEPARFGFFVVHDLVVLDTSVKTGKDYGVVVTVHSASQVAQVLRSQVTFWGVPGDARHDQSRGWSCVERGIYAPDPVNEPCLPPTSRNESPFLTLPTACGGPLATALFADSWNEPGARLADGSIDVTDPRWKRGSTSSPAQAGCDLLPFSPSILLEPDTSAGSTPTGLKVNVHVPQDSTLSPTGLGEAAVKQTTVTLPTDLQLNPSAANGLAGCSEAQIGYTGRNPETQTDEFTNKPGTCPDGSKVGAVRVKTPDLANELEGFVYLASPQNFAGPPPENPFQSLVALYIEAEDPVSRVLVKLAGEVHVDEQTGQVTSTFKNTPQVPFEDFKLDFFDGPRASVSSPPLCGGYTTAASFTPWSGTADVPSSSNFAISSGPGGSGCANPQPFAPGFVAQSKNLQAGGFTPFTVDITRHDSDQAVQGVTMKLPPGLAAMLSKVTLCPEPQASQGACPPDSQIGRTTVTAGLGPDPFTPPEGKVFITGPYKGAPFGLSIVSPAVAPPFDLGTVIVRSKILIDRTTAQVTVDSDPLPLRLRGLPLQLQHIHVIVERPGNQEFQFNPTNCSPLKVEGTLTGAQGATSAVSSNFQVANCGALPFKPKLTASTKGNASKLNGASLTVKVESTPGQANIAKTRLVLPIALPSRLTTIQKACRDTVFEVNPAACDEGSNIGSAVVHTPVLKNPLTGPAYLVSHGNAAFPDVEFVLQGEGITLILDGQTDIKKGITTSTFNAVPDAPVTTFETTLPQGPHSALTSNVAASKKFSLCGTKLVMPTTITGQNGAVIKQETKIPVTGCKAKIISKAEKLKKALKKCRKQFAHKKKKRVACEKAAKKKYGPKKAKKKSKKKK
ncbi:MAG TPA: hypothetical protein VN672_03835 [Solirubrobacteraceae bacterium]|nr:hypothetical protein [Solirubrobacteraceae bacterium]